MKNHNRNTNFTFKTSSTQAYNPQLESNCNSFFFFLVFAMDFVGFGFVVVAAD
jgi:hypothetical protein